MKNFLTVLGLMALGTASAFATTCSVTAGQNNLIAGNTAETTALGNGLTTPTAPVPNENPCTVGPLTFSNFTYDLDAGAFTTTPASVNLENASYAGGIVNFGFDPNLASSSDLEFEFEVQGGIEGISLSLTAITGTGFVNEVACTVFIGPNQTCASAGGTALAILDVTATGVSETTFSGGIPTTVNIAGNGIDAVATFAPTQTVWIYKDLNSGNDPYSEVNQDYVIPEPVTTSLVGLGLLGIGFLGRRLRK